MPELKRFLYDSVLQDEYEGLHVSFIPGATPELVLYGPDQEELSREVIGVMTFNELHAFVQAKGFKRVTQEVPAPDEAQVEGLTAAAEDAGAEADDATAYDYQPLPGEDEDDTAYLDSYEDMAAAQQHQEL